MYFGAAVTRDKSFFDVNSYSFFFGVNIGYISQSSLSMLLLSM